MIISSRKNPSVLHFRELNRERKTREAERLFNIEGVKVCIEAVRAGLTVVNAFVTETAVKKYPDAYEELCRFAEPTVITDELGQFISDTKSPQGFFITAGMLDNSQKMSTIECGRSLILDGLQDAGNVGTIIRTCDAFGLDGVILSPECADIYSPKVVRSAMGSLFRLPAAVAEPSAAVARMRASGTAVYAAVLNKDARPLGSEELPERCAVVIGNEGSGVSEAVIKAADECIYIPIVNAESLNASVAAAIFCYRLRKIKKG